MHQNLPQKTYAATDTRLGLDIMELLKLIKIPFRGYQIIIAKEDNNNEEFTVAMQKANETTFGNTLIEQLTGTNGSDLLDIMGKMSLKIDALEQSKK